jgi:RNA polymerase sigma-70 factor (ECF subfamily)
MTKTGTIDQSLMVASRDEHDATPARPLDLREVFTMHAPYVWNTLRRLGISGADLEDLTHDVFTQVHRHLHEYDPSRPVKPWLFGFAFRIAAEQRRRTQRRREEPLESEPIDPVALPDARLAAEQDRQLVVAALAAIELERRAVFVLYEIDGVPMDEIASSLGIPPNTGYSRLRLARAEFAAAVKRLKLRRGDR